MMKNRATSLRGFVKLKNFQKSEKNSDWSDPTQPPPYPFFYFFGNTWKYENNTKNTKFPKKIKNPSWGLTHPPTSEFFSDFFIFFNLTKPLNYQIINNCWVNVGHLRFLTFLWSNNGQLLWSKDFYSSIIIYLTSCKSWHFCPACEYIGIICL